MSNYSSLINGPVPVLVDFTAAWCGPCQAMAPELKKVASDLSDKVKIIKIDIDKNEARANTPEIRSVPTLLLYKDGKRVWRETEGVMEKHVK